MYIYIYIYTYIYVYNYAKSPFLMVKLTISMAIFNSNVNQLPEGN